MLPRAHPAFLQAFLGGALLAQTAGCALLEPRPGEAPTAPCDCLATADPQAEALRERTLAGLQLRMLTRDAELIRVRNDLAASEKRLDEALLELVRTKAKLRSLDSRAEAASAMAESEVLLKTLRSNSAIGARDQDLVQADQLLARSSREFQAENYGGAFFLASSAKALLDKVATRSRMVAPGAADDSGEAKFAVPLKIQLSTRGNIREAPRLEGRIVRTADKGTPALGLSHRELWVLVELEDGTRGWAFHDLLEPR